MRLHKILLLSILLAGCASTSSRAPLEEHDNTQVKKTSSSKKKIDEKDWRPQIYTVQKGDTLYGIAFNHGLDYREIAELNNIQDPNVIQIGQQLRLMLPANAATSEVAVEKTPVADKPIVAAPITNKKVDVTPLPPAANNPLIKEQPKLVKYPYSEAALAKLEKESTKVVEKPVVAVVPKPDAKVEAKPEPKAEIKTEAKPTVYEEEDGLEWSMPTSGKLIATFSDASNNKGIDIAGKQGQPVFASAPGKVVYSGSGLRGYGKLIIIKHNSTYLSAYAHNDQIMVKEGQTVTRGQKIAEMGSTDADQVKLHFEVRRLGKPVDPAKYLPLNKS